MAVAASGLQITAARPSIFPARRILGAAFACVCLEPSGESCHLSSIKPPQRSITSASSKTERVIPRAMSEAGESRASSGLSLDLRGKRAFIAGVEDDNGYGWAIAKSLAAAVLKFLSAPGYLLPDGSLMEIAKVYPLDAVFDSPEDVPEDVKTNKRYAGSSNWTVKEFAETVKQDFGSIDVLMHSLANGPEVTKPVLETSRRGYLAAISAPSYCYVSLLKHFLPIMKPGGSSISLTYIASEKIIPGYGGGMSSAKAALESDTRVSYLIPLAVRTLSINFFPSANFQQTK